jgi:hypothetical protein
MTGTLKGALHVHSTYSDGDFTLAELREVLLADGCRFVCMTDHAEAFDDKKLKAYQEECRSLSSDEFLFLPGLEYECEQRMHILGYGATQLASSKAPQRVIRDITGQGAIAVIAHPKNEFLPWIEEFEELPDGIEVWNSKYDGRYAPRPQTFVLLQRLRERKSDLHAFYGLDLHWKKQYRGLLTEVKGGVLKPESILAALAAGAYEARKGDLDLPSSGVLPTEVFAQFSDIQQKSHRMRGILKDGKRMLDRMGIRVPASLKAQLRRIF